MESIGLELAGWVREPYRLWFESFYLVLKALVAVLAVAIPTRVGGILAAALLFSGSRLLITHWRPFTSDRSLGAFVVSSMSLVAVAMLVLGIETGKQALGRSELDGGSEAEVLVLRGFGMLWLRYTAYGAAVLPVPILLYLAVVQLLEMLGCIGVDEDEEARDVAMMRRLNDESNSLRRQAERRALRSQMNASAVLSRALKPGESVQVEGEIDQYSLFPPHMRHGNGTGMGGVGLILPPVTPKPSLKMMRLAMRSSHEGNGNYNSNGLNHSSNMTPIQPQDQRTGSSSSRGRFDSVNQSAEDSTSAGLHNRRGISGPGFAPSKVRRMSALDD